MSTEMPTGPMDPAELRAGIELGQLVLHYQPKVDAVSGQLRGVESLVRWNHPDHGLVPPQAFIGLAETEGLIGRLGEWVLTEACRQQVEWNRTLGASAPPVVCVNVSGLQLVPGFVEVVARCIAETSALPEGLCLEISETAAMDDIEAAVGMVQELKTLGLVVSIDDFGTAHSSLSRLQRFPIDEVKIDKSITDLLGTDSEDRSIVAAIIAVAHALGLLAIAEGVETSDQLLRLRELGCDTVQGYLFSRPLPPEEIGALGLFLRPKEPTGDPAAAREAAQLVLVVDDTDDLRALASISLTSSGFQVLEASNGEDALAQARLAQPDGIVLDVQMPGMNGFEVCRALRADPLTAGAAILMLTTLADARDKIEAFSAGADDYMLKPFAPRELASRIRQAIARRAISRNP